MKRDALDRALLRGVAGRRARLYAFVIDRLTERREVADVQTTTVYEHVRSRYIDPSPAPREP